MMVNKGQGEIAEVRHADRRDYAVDVDDVDAMLGGIGGRGAKIAQSQTRRDQRGGQKCLSLSRDKSGWNMQRCAFCKMQRRLQTRKRSEMELNRRGRLQAGGGKSTFEVGLRLKLIYYSFIQIFEVGLSLQVD